MLDDYILNNTIRDEFTMNGATLPSYMQLELLEPNGLSPFPGPMQNEVDLTTSCRQACLPHDEFVSFADFIPGDCQVKAHSSIDHNMISSERLLTVADEPISIFTSSLQSLQKPTRTTAGNRKTQLSELAAPKSTRRSSRRDSTNDLRRKGIGTYANKIDLSNEVNIHKQSTKYKRVQERNRIAAIKCRIRKREDLARLQSDEQAIEQRHRILSRCVNELNEEILRLKTQLLQHTNCNCNLIQNYIKAEAAHYIHVIGPRLQQYEDTYPRQLTSTYLKHDFSSFIPPEVSQTR
ncbi:hypothetical protein BGZ63DRAFT_362751 [Mariannaea sp. PMI_226]|nr:hypothetical protein BGZ63DRAFT_362751 [Mariannaea sp. PMI_226]